MSAWWLLPALALGSGEGHALNAAPLPVCGNRLVQEVVKRVGCTLGDFTCWRRRGGFCADYIDARVAAGRPGVPMELVRIKAEEVVAGDVALFAIRAHYAYVERVLKDEGGRPMAVDLAEYNFGTCWVDRTSMVTDQFKVVGRRAGVPLREVDGGFLRPRILQP